MKKESGITLIALIVTVIVLLIVSAVAIIDIGRAKDVEEAKEQQTIAVEKETIALAMNEWTTKKATSRENETFKAFMTDKLLNDANVEGPDNGPLTVTFKKSGNIYNLNENGTIELFRGLALSPNKLILKIGEESKTLKASLHGIKGDITWECEDKNGSIINMTIEGNSATITPVAEGQTTITVRSGEYTATSNIEVKGPREGKCVRYRNILWNILYDEEDRIELVTQTTYGRLTLGGSSIGISLQDYNNAINMITDKCVSELENLGIVGEEVRSVGGPWGGESENTNYIDFTTFSGLKNASYINSRYNVICEDRSYFDADWAAMQKYQITGGNYWVATRWMVYDSTYRGWGSQTADGKATFGIGGIDSGRSYIGNLPCTLFTITGEPATSGSSKSFNVRPVIKVSPSILEDATGAGTYSDPLIAKTN